MTKALKSPAAPQTATGQQKRSPAEDALAALDIDYELLPDGKILVEGNISLSSKRLTRLPDLSNVIVTGSFWCDCNRLTSLEGAPASVGGHFYCYNNQLTSLEGAPPAVGGGFFCSDNQLASLEHAPAEVGEDFYCHGNPLEFLEHAPQKFRKLKSNFGEFSSWDAIPDEVRFPPGIRERVQLEREQSIIRQATVLDSAITVKKPLHFQKPPGCFGT